MVRGWPGIGETPHEDTELARIWAFERAKQLGVKNGPTSELIKLIRDYQLPHECVPNDAKGDAKVWEAMLPSMGITAIIRNLGKMTSVGLLTPLGDFTKIVCDRLRDVKLLKAGRVHPLAILVASQIYAQGHGDKGSLTWTPVHQILAALNDAFYLAFKTIEPTNKRWMLALDVSGSMGMSRIAGMSGITPRVGSAAMALVTAATEKQHEFVAFTSGNYPSMHSRTHRLGSGISPLAIFPGDRLDEVVEKISDIPFGGTDCALPMIHARENQIPVDCFVVYTDSETWHGAVHPHRALQDYRQKMGIGAKLIVVGMVANEFTIADPSDAGMLDVVGFDSAVPQVMADFVRA
jgi:60 kDa SS-A/Ro ribonucleoprotein